MVYFVKFVVRYRISVLRSEHEMRSVRLYLKFARLCKRANTQSQADNVGALRRRN